MSIHVQWYCSGLVLYAQFGRSITVEDLNTFTATIQQMVDSSDAPLVHLVADLSSLENHPALRDIMKHFKLPARIGWSLILGMAGSTMMRFIAQVVASAFRLRYRQVQSLDEALDFLQKMDSTLPDLRTFRHVIDEPVPVS
jgi:hypothetical protein